MSSAENGLLKFITCGSVDDVKSTLIGHILYDSKLLYADQEQALILDSQVGSRGGAIDYSLLLDGLMAEREQGITIDVAYRYFKTDALSRELGLKHAVIIPVSATEGDNVTVHSDKMKWYHGETLLNHLETVNISNGAPEPGFYMPVQRVCRPNHSFRGFQ